MNRKLLENEEYFEAFQETVNNARNELVEKLPEEEKKKFDAVNEAMKVLIDNGVNAWLFPLLPISEDETAYYHYNTGNKFIKYADDGIQTVESGIEYGKNFRKFIYTIGLLVNMPIEDSYDENKTAGFFRAYYEEARDWIEHGIEPLSVRKWREHRSE